MDDIQIYNRELSPEQVLALSNNRTDLIVSQETSVGDIWSACITPNDGTVDGIELCSNDLTIVGCGNDVIEGTEVCDGSDLAGETCMSQMGSGYTGTLACNAGCDGFDTSGCNSPPTHTTPVLTSEVGTDTTNEDLTVTPQNVDDADGDVVNNIINWSKNGTSITLLNMPFEKVDGTDSNNAKDYSGNGHTGTVSGATWSATAGHDGKGAYSFDGSNDYINLGT
ncbi:MAG: hypothetical protein ACYTBZ_13980, partial [Planctomycetota bacterium]